MHNDKMTLLTKLAEAEQARDHDNESATRSKLREFIDYVTAQSGRGIAPAAAVVLAADGNFVIGAL